MAVPDPGRPGLPVRLEGLGAARLPERAEHTSVLHNGLVGRGEGITASFRTGRESGPASSTA